MELNLHDLHVTYIFAVKFPHSCPCQYYSMARYIVRVPICSNISQVWTYCISTGCECQRLRSFTTKKAITLVHWLRHSCGSSHYVMVITRGRFRKVSWDSGECPNHPFNGLVPELNHPFLGTPMTMETLAKLHVPREHLVAALLWFKPTMCRKPRAPDDV